MYFVFNTNGNHGKGDTLESAFEYLYNEGDDLDMKSLVWYKAEKINVKLITFAPPKAKIVIKKQSAKKVK
jgi:hypothetical protein